MEQHTQQQYCMRWNTHGSTLLAEFTNLLANTSLVDVTLFAEGHLLKAHKVVLSACSPYFKRLFSETREGHPIVVLKDVGHQELRCLLEYMYRGEVNVAHDQLGPLIRTAESLRIKGLADGPRTALGPPPTTPGPAPTPPAEEAIPTPPPAAPIAQDRVKVKTETNEGVPGLTETRTAVGDARSSLGRTGGPTAETFSLPPSSVPSVLSKVLTMPPALSLASTLPTLPPPQDTPIRPCSPPNKRRRRRRSGEGGDSGESDGRSSASPGDPLHSLPRIPATITPVTAPNTAQHHHQQHQQGTEDERNISTVSGSGGSSSPSPDSLGGSSKGDTAPTTISPQPRPLSAHDHALGSPFKPFLPRPDESSSDANHHSDDEAEERMSRPTDHGTPDTPGPSTSRLHPPDDPPQTPSYLSWPYPPDPSTSNESSPFPSLENTNQDYLRAYNLVRAGFPGLLPPRVGSDILVRPPPIGLPLLLKNRGGDFKFGGDYKFGGGSKPSPGGSGPSSGIGGGVSGLSYPFPDTPKQFACEKCGRTYASTGNLKRHKKYECGVEPQFSCPICKKKFQHRHSVKIHVFSTHRNEAGEGGPTEGTRSSPGLFPTSEGLGGSVGVAVGCKEEYFPIPQEANAPPSQNQDS